METVQTTLFPMFQKDLEIYAKLKLYGTAALAMPYNRGISNEDAEKAKARVLANRYQVIKKIGSGNFGTAFLVKDLNPGKTEEFKVLKEIPVGDLPADETIDAVREANLLSKLSHPNIVKFCDSFLDGEFFCLVTEYCEGGDLDQRITALKKTGKRLDETIVLNYLIQLTMAVEYMHRRRVLHRDLKSRNIFLKGNMVKIGDFGISRILMGTTDQASTFVGTPYYMSPEVLHHDGYNSKSDIWSIGCILYEMCAKKHAFEGQGLMGVMYKIVEGKPPRLPDEYSNGLQDVLHKIFIKDPQHRISAAEILKLSIVERHIEMMRINMSLQYKDIKDCSSLILKKEEEEISDLLAQQATLMSGGGPEHAQATLTPKEQMTMRKMQEADQRGKELAAYSSLNFMSNHEISKIRKEKTFVSSDMLPLKPRVDPPEVTISALEPSRGVYYNPNGTLTPAQGPAVEDETFMAPSKVTTQPGPPSRVTTLPLPPTKAPTAPGHPKQSVSFTATSRTPPMAPTAATRAVTTATCSASPTATDTVTGTNAATSMALIKRPTGELIVRPPATLVPSYRNAAYDERPITPMKDTNIYDLKYSDMDFKDALLNDGKMAETYYSQYEHEFEEDPEEEEEKEEEGDAEDTLQEDTVADFYSYLQLALNQDATADKTKTFSEDPIRGVYGASVREWKIRNLRRECIDKLGQEVFEKVYGFLRRKRIDDPEENETLLMNDLRTITPNMSDCFLVDQLIFLETD